MMAEFRSYGNRVLKINVDPKYLNGDELLYCLESETNNTQVVVAEQEALVVVDNRKFRIDLK